MPEIDQVLGQRHFSDEEAQKEIITPMSIDEIPYSQLKVTKPGERFFLEVKEELQIRTGNEEIHCRAELHCDEPLN
jgi:hypothetical protein